MKRKNPKDVRGMRVRCPRFEQCPLCYGCRAFDSHSLECAKCERENRKLNICNREKHKPSILAKMIKREVIEVESN